MAKIHAYISRDSPSAADRMMYRLTIAARGLDMFPRRGKRGVKPGTRELTTVRPYVIVYWVRRDGSVDIEAIWHSAQNRG
jgi:toxin ParE1/3/4